MDARLLLLTPGAVLQQCIDIVLGAMTFHLNNQHMVISEGAMGPGNLVYNINLFIFASYLSQTAQLDLVTR